MPDDEAILSLLSGGDEGEKSTSTAKVARPPEPGSNLDKSNFLDKHPDRARSDECTIMVMSLHPKTDERAIYKFFMKCGKVRDVQIVVDPHSGKSKGIGYVEFYDAASVLKAIHFSGHLLSGQPVRIQPVNMPRDIDREETPLERQVRVFLSENGIHPEQQGAIALKQAPPEVQRSVLSAGILEGARNPSAVLLVRIQNAPASQVAAARRQLGMGTVLSLANMFDPASVDLKVDPDFYDDVEEDVAQECARHGLVVGAIVDRNASDGRVIVKFGGAAAAASAQIALHGRTFGGQTITAGNAFDHEFDALLKARQMVTSKPLVSASYRPPAPA
jgi:RNA-binding protein 39